MDKNESGMLFLIIKRSPEILLSSKAYYFHTLCITGCVSERALLYVVVHVKHPHSKTLEPEHRFLFLLFVQSMVAITILVPTLPKVPT